MASQICVVIPVKPLAVAKTRLRGAADRGVGRPLAHSRLALALALDTVAAATKATRVRRVMVVTSDPAVRAAMGVFCVDVVPDLQAGDLNTSLEYGATLLRSRYGHTAVAALPADLPALSPIELDEAVAAAETAGERTAARAFCADMPGTGTTLLIAPPGLSLRPLFGDASALRHMQSGARPLRGHWPGLRRDVDVPSDLRRASELGLGVHTQAALAGATAARLPDG